MAGNTLVTTALDTIRRRFSSVTCNDFVDAVRVVYGDAAITRIRVLFGLIANFCLQQRLKEHLSLFHALVAVNDAR